MSGFFNEYFSGLGDPNSDAMGLLALASVIAPNSRVPRGFLQMGQAYQKSAKDAEDRKIAHELKQLQMSEARSQIADRERKGAAEAQRNAWIQNLLASADQQAGNAAVVQQTGGLAPTMENARTQRQAAADNGGALAGISRDAIMFDLQTTGGKNIGEWINKRTTPKWENVNGNLVNTSEPGFRGGFQPGMNASANGQVTAWQPDGQGGLVVGAPRGALDTFGAYRKAEEGAKADFDLVKVRNPQTQRDEWVPRARVLQESTPPQQQVQPVAPVRQPSQFVPVPQQQAGPGGAAGSASLPPAERGLTGAFTGTPEQVATQIGNMRDPQEQANAWAAFQEQQRRERRGGGGVAAGPSDAEQANSKLNEKFAEGQAGQALDLRSKAIAAKQALPTLWSAQELLKAGTFNGMGADAKMNVVRALGALGVPVPESVVNSQSFDATIAQVVGQNLKPMMGATNLSNVDLEFVKQMFGTRGQEAKAVKYLLDKAVDSNFRTINEWNGELPKLQARGAQDSPIEIPTKPAAGGAAAAIPSAAVDMLRANPALRAQFDQKYGPGAAARALGQ